MHFVACTCRFIKTRLVSHSLCLCVCIRLASLAYTIWFRRAHAPPYSRDNKAVACAQVWNVARRKYIAGTEHCASPSGSHDSLFSLLAKHTETHARRQTHPYYDYVYLAVTLSNRTHSLRASQNTESARSKAAAYMWECCAGKTDSREQQWFFLPPCTFVNASLCGRPLCAPIQMDKFSLSLLLTTLYISSF